MKKLRKENEEKKAQKKYQGKTKIGKTGSE